MSANAHTILHHLRNIATVAGYSLDGDSLAELRDALENIDEQIRDLQDEVRALRKQVPDNRCEFRSESMSLKKLQDWQYNNVQRACNEAVREALSYGVEAEELKQMMAECWFAVLNEKAELGMRALAQH